RPDPALRQARRARRRCRSSPPLSRRKILALTSPRLAFSFQNTYNLVSWYDFCVKSAYWPFVMSSLRLQTQLQQRMILTPQLRQRIEMLQMTALELNELVEQELVANPILEEVMPGEEVQEISDN